VLAGSNEVEAQLLSNDIYHEHPPFDCRFAKLSVRSGQN
jgi:hypothetical protein